MSISQKYRILFSSKYLYFPPLLFDQVYRGAGLKHNLGKLVTSITETLLYKWANLTKEDNPIVHRIHF